MQTSRISLCMVVIHRVLLCNGLLWWRSSNSIRMSTVKPAEHLLVQQYVCIKRLVTPTNFFSLNVTLNSSAFLEDPEDAELTLSSEDNTWHYLESPSNCNAVDDIEVKFTLIYNETLSGNCTFFLDTFIQNTDNQTGTATTVTEFTSPTYFENITEVDTNWSTQTTKPTMPVNTTTCLCPCECTRPLSKEREDAMLEEILNYLRIPKSLTSFSKRKLSSATDMRLSSKSIGLLGAFVLTAVFGVIFIGDTKLFLHNARTTLGYLRDRYNF